MKKGLPASWKTAVKTKPTKEITKPKNSFKHSNRRTVIEGKPKSRTTAKENSAVTNAPEAPDTDI